MHLYSAVWPFVECPVKQLIYASMAVGDTATTALAVLERAAVFNVSRRITGLLLVGSHSYAQVLEGGDGEVDDLYGRIQRDPRHTKIRTVSEQAVTQRLWPAWAMHVIAPTESNVRLLQSHGVRFEDHFPQLTVTRLRSLLYAFSEVALSTRPSAPVG